MNFQSYARDPRAGAAAAPARVLHLIPEQDRIGTARQVTAIAQGLAKAGGDSVIAGGSPRMEAVFRRAGLDHRPYRPERPGLFQSNATHALMDTIHQRGLDLIHVHGADMGLTAKAFAEAANLPLVMSCAAPPDAGGFLGRRAARKHLAGRPVIVPTRFAAECLRRDFGLPESAVAVVPPGIDAAAWDEAAVSSERSIALALAWGIGDDARDVILVPDASTDPAWVDWVLTAATHPDAPDAVWVMVGGGPDAEDRMNQFLDRTGANTRVRWIPQCNDWQAALKLASVVLSLPMDRTTPNVMALEAQAMGRPVIVSDAGAGSEMLVPGKTGWLVRTNDSGSLLYATVSAMSRERVIRNAMAMAARNFVASHFAPQAMQAAMLEIYAQALAAR